jgi:hypothetical protein
VPKKRKPPTQLNINPTTNWVGGFRVCGVAFRVCGFRNSTQVPLINSSSSSSFLLFPCSLRTFYPASYCQLVCGCRNDIININASRSQLSNNSQLNPTNNSQLNPTNNSQQKSTQQKSTQQQSGSKFYNNSPQQTQVAVFTFSVLSEEFYPASVIAN